jgi:hypothetical protein
MLLAIVVVAAGLSCGAPQRADLAGCERALREGTVVSSREVGQGISGAVLVRLRQGDAEVAAVFKSAETIVESDFSFHGETVATYRDTWKHEVAAYELDRLLALRLVPPTVERKLGGKRGSLQAWAERPLSRFGQGPPPEDPARADTYMHAQRFFDYLTFNTDRHVRNVLLGSDWRPVAIDNSITFHPFVRPYRPLHRFPRGPAEALERLDPHALRERLGRYLEKDEIQGLLARRARLLTLMAAARAEGRADAFFEW